MSRSSFSPNRLLDDDKALSSALALIKQFEGCVLHPYLCPASCWTIGWGSRIMPDGTEVTKESKNITQEQADQMLSFNISNLFDEIKTLVTFKITSNQAAALIDFAYNLGLTRLKESTLLKKLNIGDIRAAANEFPRWDHVNGKPMAGLLKRREAEKTLFLKGALS